MTGALRASAGRLCAALAAGALAASLSGLAAPLHAQTPTAQPRAPLIFVPGLMGSRLCRDNPDRPGEPLLVWGSAAALRHFPTIRLPRDAAPDGIKPCGLLREIVFLGPLRQEVYGPVIRHLESIGYREGQDLFLFDYDWRRGAFDNARALDAFIRATAGDRQVDILAHSMGGLIARVYTVKYGGGRVARLLSAGTPFQGAAKVYQTVEKGWGPLNAAMGGLAGFRRTMLSFPSIFELMPRYEGCCDAGAQPFAPARADTWTALGWEGVEPAAMPDLAVTAARIRDLGEIIAGPLPAGIEDVLLVGVDQRTTQRVSFQTAGKTTAIQAQTSWAGDGTVLRDSAVLPRTALHPTSFAIHERILHDPQIQDFLKVALTKTVAAAVDGVPVRPRGSVLSAGGEATELVGIVVEPADPVYRTGDTGIVRVHVRLGTTARLLPQTIRLTQIMPDGHEIAIPLTPDPAASEPGNAFEQSLRGSFAAGAVPGTGMLRTVVAIAQGAPRVVEEPVLVIAR